MIGEEYLQIQGRQGARKLERISLKIRVQKRFRGLGGCLEVGEVKVKA